MKRVRMLFLITYIVLLVSCNLVAPSRKFRFTDYGMTDGIVEYIYLPSGWYFDYDDKTAIGRIENTILYALDSRERFVKAQKYWYEDMDRSIARRSDVTLPDRMDENNKIILNNHTLGGEMLILSDQASAEFRLYMEKEGDTISKALQSEIMSNTRPITTIWIWFPQIEGLKYRSNVELYYYKGNLYFENMNRKVIMEILHDTTLYQEIIDWHLTQVVFLKRTSLSAKRTYILMSPLDMSNVFKSY